MIRPFLWTSLLVLILFVYMIQSSSVQKIEGDNLSPEDSIKVCEYAVCKLCNNCYSGGDEFLRHCQSAHPEAYQSFFETTRLLYRPILTIDVDTKSFSRCRICQFAVPLNDRENHFKNFHNTRTQFDQNRSSSSSASQIVPIPNPQKRRKAVGALRSQEYQQRFGSHIPNFDEYFDNMRILFDEMDGATSTSDKSSNS